MIKTIGDLRKLLKENEGYLVFGEIVISSEIIDGEETDIDIYIDGRLSYWVKKDITDEVFLEDKNTWIKSTHLMEETKEKTVEVVEKTDKKAEGMVEAYEKILSGRKITIERDE